MDSYRNEFGVTSLSLQVGECDTERRIVWYQIQERVGARVIYAKASDYDRDGGFTEKNATIVEAKTEIPYGNKRYISCKARIKGLELGEEYIYSVGDASEFDCDTYHFYIQKNPDKKCSFGIVSDVHFNVYGRNPDDIYFHMKLVNWSEVVRHIRNYGEELPAFIMSIGDNSSVYHMPASRYADPSKCTLEGRANFCEKEHEEFFYVPFMKQTAFASVLGNHDSHGHTEAYPYASVTGYHFDMPNDDGVTGHFDTYSHGDFFYICGKVLIIGLNMTPHKFANHHGSVEEHRAFILRAIEAHPECKWRLIFNHVPAYAYVGSADINPAGAETETSKMRKLFPELLDGIDIDVIFTGHQHAFSRSYNVLSNGEVADRDKLVTETDENGYQSASIKDPRGILHYNVPAPSNYSFFSSISEDCNEVYPNYGIAECAIKTGKEAGMDAEIANFRGFLYNQMLYTYVTVEETDESYRMTIKTNRYSDDMSLDTYTIEKTK